MSLESVVRVLREDDNFLIMYHRSPDPDAMGSALALAIGLQRMGKKVRVYKFNNMNEKVKAMAGVAGELFVEKPSLTGTLVVVDTSSAGMLDSRLLSTFKGKKIAIDHHTQKEVYPDFDVVYIDEGAIATSLIIYEILEELGIGIDPKIAKLLGIGIIADSANFVVADARMFKVLSEITSVIDYHELTKIANMPAERSERVAVLKGASRLQLHFVRDFIIATTIVSSFEGSVARALIELGADISFVGSRNGETKVSARARQDLVKAGLHLGRDIMPKVASRFGGDAGGHAGAAGASGFSKQDLDQVLQLCVDLVTDYINKKVSN